MLSDAGKIGHQGEPLHHYHFLRQADHRRDGAGVDGCDDADRVGKHGCVRLYADHLPGAVASIIVVPAADGSIYARVKSSGMMRRPNVGAAACLLAVTI